MFTERQQKILDILAKTPGFITSEEIARRCGVSSKTVRNEIRAVQQEMPAEAAVITVTKRNGISLLIKNPEVWRQEVQMPADESDEAGREKQILRLICADKSNAQIAQVMNIKLTTVKTHVSHILEKLDVSRRSEAKTAAKRLKLIPEDV